MRTTRLASLVISVALAGCGSNGGNPPDVLGDPPDAGPDAELLPGTSTLHVEGTFTVENPDNITVGNTLMVFCDLRVTKDGAPVANAIVTVNPAPPAFQAVLTGDELDPSHYRGTYFAYAKTARLTISANMGQDYVFEAVMQGPELYVIEQPVAGVPQSVASDLHVTWSLPGGAVDSADVELESGFSMTMLPDDGSFDIPAASLVVGEDNVEVTRWNRNTIPGAAPGSFIDFGIHNKQPVTIQ
jgi:hypothetical protein